MWKASSTHKRRLRAGHRSRSCSPGTGPASRSRPGGGTPRRARPASRAGRGGVRCARRRPGPARPRIWRDRLRPGPGRAGPEVLLDERNHRADVLKADPEALAPPDPHRPPGPGRIDHLDHHTTATSRDDAATGQPLTGSQGSMNRPGFVRGSQVPRRRVPVRGGCDGRRPRARRAESCRSRRADAGD